MAPSCCFSLCRVAFFVCALLSSSSPFGDAWTASPADNQQTKQPPQQQQPPQLVHHRHSYDLVIIGAGSSGFAACAAARLLGRKTALVEINSHLGGDCTNSACVPSKALRSIASLQQQQQSLLSALMPLQDARQYVKDTVYAVRAREDPGAVDERNSNLNVFLVSNCHFVSSHELQLVVIDDSKKTNNVVTNNTKIIILHAKNFVIATGAAPIVPSKWMDAAAKANLPLCTYRSLLSPEGDEMIWDLISSSSNNNNNNNKTTEDEDETTSSSNDADKKQLLIVGGGATACELGQSLAKLAGGRLLIHLVAPEILPLEDVHLRSSALRLLLHEGVQYHRDRVPDQLVADDDRKVVLLDSGKELGPLDAVLVCVGRSPAASLESLSLDRAGIQWNQPRGGVTVNPHTMQSVSQPHIYAVGDCADAIPLRSRCGAQAAWTGFHAVRNIVVPRLLRWGSRPSINPCVPRVIYTTPELASVGMTYVECVEKYGRNGFDCMYVPELGSDRADMDRATRRTDLSFLELRVAKRGGNKILGCTSCGPAAAEIVNSMGMAITNHLTVRDVARSPHSYPSHGYLLHRMALSLALSNVFGLLEACGPVGGCLASIGRFAQSLFEKFKSIITFSLPRQRSRLRQLRDWEATGARNAILWRENGNGHNTPTTGVGSVQLLSFLDIHANVTLRNEADELAERAGYSPKELQNYKDWIQSKPSFTE